MDGVEGGLLWGRGDFEGRDGLDFLGVLTYLTQDRSLGLLGSFYFFFGWRREGSV